MFNSIVALNIDTLFRGIFDNEFTVTVSIFDFLLCIGISLFIGLLMAGAYMIGSRYTKSFLLTLSLLPAIVCVVIMMVNGNIGAGVAVAGAFSLVRFRSAPGSAKEIVYIFMAMGAGIITGMGYLGFAVLFSIIMCAMFIILNLLSRGQKKGYEKFKTVRIVIPENLDYSDVFDDIFDEYTVKHELVRVKTVNMGSLYKLSYDIVLKDPKKEKEFIDNLRCRNGNLEITVSKQEADKNEF